MIMTRFAEKFSRKTGILELMDDLGRAMNGKDKMLMLGGGNPAHIPEINKIWRERVSQILKNGSELEKSLVNYDTPQGKDSFIRNLAELLNREFSWNVKPENIAVTNGSQSAMFYLINLFGGKGTDGIKRKILFPLSPEYIGYADQGLEEDIMISVPGKIEKTRPGFFKYRVDFENINITGDISALCVSRPTNPTGNVLTDEEIKRLSALAADNNIPLIIDNAYGTPFPHILFRDVKPFWNENIILSMSLSKLGLPSLRTGIIIADKEIIKAVSAVNAVVSLSNVSLGQVIVNPLIESGEILEISRNIIKPFYKQRSDAAVENIRTIFGDSFPYRIHESEGAMFLWLWFENLPVHSSVLYERLKKRGVLVISGHYFFYGLERKWKHSGECLRLSYAQDKDDFKKAAEIIAEEVRYIYK
jgi:valine--pyruvate aminotransferase